MSDVDPRVQQMIDGMSIEEKVGQCLVIGFVGATVTPHILRRIREIKPAGVRVGLTMRTKNAIHDPYATCAEHADRIIRQPKDGVRDLVLGYPCPHITNEQWATYINALRAEAKKVGVPLHVTFDMEGGNSADYNRGGIHYFPACFGLGRSGDPQLAKDVAWAVSRQMHALGFDWIHSPVLDVNTNADNPEIGVRAYSDDIEEACTYGLAALEGFTAGKIITTGKHFPGRGASVQDAHHQLPVIDLPEAEMREHLKTFQALIDAGLPTIMTAHTAYPCFDDSGRPATLSKKILTDLLKVEMGFEGCITTDDITMGGIVAEFEVVDACIESINAGADLILFRDESSLIDETVPLLVEAVRDGRIAMERIDDALRRSLGVKARFGMLDDDRILDPAQAGAGITDPKVVEIAQRAAEQTTGVLRDDGQLLPLPTDQKILLVEQVPVLHALTNDGHCHPGLLWEAFNKRSELVAQVECTMGYSDDDQQRVMARIDECDLLVVTNYYYRRGASGNEFVQKLAALGKPMVVITDCPFPAGVQPSYQSIVLSYGVSPESIEEIAKVCFEAGRTVRGCEKTLAACAG